jgi:hypothetical protein
LGYHRYRRNQHDVHLPTLLTSRPSTPCWLRVVSLRHEGLGALIGLRGTAGTGWVCLSRPGPPPYVQASHPRLYELAREGRARSALSQMTRPLLPASKLRTTASLSPSCLHPSSDVRACTPPMPRQRRYRRRRLPMLSSSWLVHAPTDLAFEQFAVVLGELPVGDCDLESR